MPALGRSGARRSALGRDSKRPSLSALGSGRALSGAEICSRARSRALLSGAFCSPLGSAGAFSGAVLSLSALSPAPLLPCSPALLSGALGRSRALSGARALLCSPTLSPAMRRKKSAPERGAQSSESSAQALRRYHREGISGAIGSRARALSARFALSALSISESSQASQSGSGSLSSSGMIADPQSSQRPSGSSALISAPAQSAL